MNASSADTGSINERLADFLSARKEEIVRTWMARVRDDADIPAESLTTNQLRNHLPRLLEDLAAILRRYGSDDAVERRERDAEKHGAERWEQGFEVPELLREIMHVRTVLVYHLRIFEEAHHEFGPSARLFAETTVHQFLDRLGIAATEQFLASDRQARRNAAGLAS